jgi:hypothetical protein
MYSPKAVAQLPLLLTPKNMIASSDRQQGQRIVLVIVVHFRQLFIAPQTMQNNQPPSKNGDSGVGISRNLPTTALQMVCLDIEARVGAIIGAVMRLYASADAHVLLSVWACQYDGNELYSRPARKLQKFNIVSHKSDHLILELNQFLSQRGNKSIELSLQGQTKLKRSSDHQRDIKSIAVRCVTLTLGVQSYDENLVHRKKKLFVSEHRIQYLSAKYRAVLLPLYVDSVEFESLAHRFSIS